MATEFALKTEDFESKVLNSELPVLIDFWAEWCGPCRVIAPFVEEIAQEYAGKAVVYKVNVDTDPLLAEKFGVVSIPTLLVFKGGQRVGHMVGANPKKKIADFLQGHL
jgi:thioredoxin 1